MKTTIKTYIELPFETDTVYQTKFQTGEKVILKHISRDKNGKIIGFGVIYENAQHLGICPLGADRLIPNRIEDGEIVVCSKCKEVL